MFQFLGFRGRLGRKGFGLTVGGFLIAVLAFAFALRPAIDLIGRFDTRGQALAYANGLTVAMVCLFVLAAWVVIATAVRRLRDMGVSWWIGLVVYLAVAVIDGLALQYLGPRVVSAHDAADPGSGLSTLLIHAGWLTVLALWPSRTPEGRAMARRRLMRPQLFRG